MISVSLKVHFKSSNFNINNILLTLHNITDITDVQSTLKVFRLYYKQILGSLPQQFPETLKPILKLQNLTEQGLLYYALLVHVSYYILINPLNVRCIIYIYAIYMD